SPGRPGRRSHRFVSLSIYLYLCLVSLRPATDTLTYYVTFDLTPLTDQTLVLQI
ncbi:hypothetical protein RUM43_001881, partial [Polyplax serrata]